MRTSLFEYDLPKRLIAQRPALVRDQSRLLVLERRSGRLTHATFAQLPEWLRPGDCLVLNDTRVLKARLDGVRRRTGGRVQSLFIDVTDEGLWHLWLQARGHLEPGERIALADGVLELELVRKEVEGGWLARAPAGTDVLATLERIGRPPLPPYIRRSQDRSADAADAERYQTVYSRRPGAIAAPTAGLHFTEALLDRIRAGGVHIATVTLHVGVGTFQPIAAEHIEEHRMHRERYAVGPETVARLEATRQHGGRIVAVGTTTVRVLETLGRAAALQAGEGWTDLYIRPPWDFRLVDALVTNFHLPRTSLLVLVATFAGRDAILRAYREAIQHQYRFYSYGDAMLIV